MVHLRHRLEAATSPDAAPDRTYKIGHATSDDGIDWIKEEARQIIADRLGPDESQALPTVIEIDGGYHMFFCYRAVVRLSAKNSARGYRIGHAWFGRLAELDARRRNPSLEADAGRVGLATCCAIRMSSSATATCILLYNGNEFGRYGFGAGGAGK